MNLCRAECVIYMKKIKKRFIFTVNSKANSYHAENEEQQIQRKPSDDNRFLFYSNLKTAKQMILFFGDMNNEYANNNRWNCLLKHKLKWFNTKVISRQTNASLFTMRQTNKTPHVSSRWEVSFFRYT